VSIMRLPPFSGARPAEPPECGYSVKKRCLIFRWVGQSFESCDQCGEPRWVHCYDPPYGGARPIFYVRQYTPWRNAWFWEPVGSLIPEKKS